MHQYLYTIPSVFWSSCKLTSMRIIVKYLTYVSFTTQNVLYTKLCLKDPFHYENTVSLTCTAHVMYVTFQPLSPFGSGLGISGGSTSRET